MFDGVLDLNGEDAVFEDEDEVGNSFFDIRYHCVRVLILTQRLDNALNLVGNMIVNLQRARAKIFIAHTIKTSFKIDLVDEQNIFFIKDVNKLKDLLLKIEADIIFCADFDDVVFQEAVEDILSKPNNNYRPEIYLKSVSNLYLNRVRFPLIKDKRNLLDNILNDDIYYEKRTDSIINDTEIKKSGDVLTASWQSLQQIAQINVYTDDFGELNLKFNDINKIFKVNKNYTEIIFDEKIFTSCVEMSANTNIKKIEIYADKEPPRVIKPFIKITSNDNFIYEYFVPKKVNRITLEIYRFHIDKPVELTVSDGVIYCRDNKFVLSFDCDELTVRAEVFEEPEIYDQIKIRRVSPFYFCHLKLKQLFKNCKMRLKRKLHKI